MQFTPLNSNFTFIKNNGFSNMPVPHYHHHYEIYYLLSGEIKYFIGDTFYTIQKNNIVLVNPMELHKTSYDQACKRLIINFSDSFLRKYLTPIAKKLMLAFFDKRILSPTLDESKNILKIFDELEEKTQQKQSHEIFLLLMKLFNIFNNLESASIKSAQNHNNSTLNNTLKYIDEHYDSIESLDEVAENLHVSKYYICKLFKKHLNTTFGEYLLNTRLQNAEKLLFNTKYDILKISNECGFSTSSYFCKIFKTKYGLSPKKYREHQIESNIT